MRLHHADRLRAVAFALAFVLVLWGRAAMAQPAEPAPAAASASSTLTREAVDQAAARLRQDPALKATRNERRLHWKAADAPPPPAEMPSWMVWLVGLVAWLNDTGRFLVWALGALLVALLAVKLRQILRAGAGGTLPTSLTLPTHVNQLDIRPEALPADIGAAALALWQQGQVLEAMSLLYRGALSQLVHRHAVPIRGSSTEGDCLRLAQPRLADGGLRYFAALVAAWRSTVYAGRPPDDALARSLCAGFDAHLTAGAPRA